jgi:hypothetical protein
MAIEGVRCVVNDGGGCVWEVQETQKVSGRVRVAKEFSRVYAGEMNEIGGCVNGKSWASERIMIKGMRTDRAITVGEMKKRSTVARGHGINWRGPRGGRDETGLSGGRKS